MLVSLAGPALIGHYTFKNGGKETICIKFDENHNVPTGAASLSMIFENPDSLRVMAQKLQEAADALEQEMLK